MTFQCSSPKNPTAESASPSGSVSSICDKKPVHMPHLQSDNLYGPLAILWDIENCPVPSDVRPEDVAGNILMALRVHPLIAGAVKTFSAYGDFNAFPRRLREGCQRTGVKLVDVPNGRKDAADKAILVDMFLFALDNQPPSSIMLISGDVDFAPALHILGQRGYTVILVIPSRVGVSSALCSAGRFVWDWPTIARGEGFVPPKFDIKRGYDFSGHIDYTCRELHIEDEAIVYKGSGFNPCSISSSSMDQSKASHSFFECSNNKFMASSSSLSSSLLQNQPSGISEAPSRDKSSWVEDTWVQPGDIQGLKGRLVKLLETSGGSLPLFRVPSEYLKSYGRPLYVSEYGVVKLVHLVNKMFDTFILVGKGHKKLLCLRNPNRHIKKFENTPIILKRDKDHKTPLRENADLGTSPNTGSSSEEFSDDERNADAVCKFDDLEDFKQEMQELLVCYSCPVPMNKFEALYEQRYKKVIDYRRLGAEGLDELVEKVRDIVELCEDQANKKFLISNFVSG
ncbi:hypothetical protein HPP92_020439 [Vanilla planifolia]|uniref:HTH OST-type domain-containing protein n=1 Tax=Vanilla planifolia TaxID=51239 RepID=A0A835Q532_VANPL|nr:hypothetical protein HPP92_020439 [Vanilla planifolia]